MDLIRFNSSTFSIPSTGHYEGLKAIEDGSLTWLDDEMYNNLNTGFSNNILGKNLEESFEFHIGRLRKSRSFAIGAIFPVSASLV